MREFRDYLRSIGCSIVLIDVAEEQKLSRIKKALKRAPKEQPVLICYNGHGSHFGWQYGVDYFRLAWTLRHAKGDLLVMNETCYGLSFLKFLKLVRQPHNTCFLSPWDSDSLTYGASISEALEFWPKSTKIEDEVSERWYSSEETGDIQVPIQYRWGANLEPLFFPPKT
jgi:hypothetical protein